MFESWQLRQPTAESAKWMEQITAAVRIENRAVAAQLVAIGQLFAYRYASGSAIDDWAVDTEAAVAAELSAGLRISQGLAADRLRLARAMRERLPQTADVFIAGDIDYRAFTTIVSRTDLIVDTDALARTDELVAINVVRWPSLTRGRLAGKIDGIVARVDADAVRRRKERQVDREVWIGSDADGISQIVGSLFTVDAHALDTRLNALAATPCAHDPRSTEQRRADALGALAAGADRLGCRCERADCAAGKGPAPSPVTIHVIATPDTLTGAATTPGCEIRADGLITAELVAELAKSATLVPLTHPGYAPPEQGYTPSKALADFVRARDLTCRWPGCDVPAFDCDIDHTIPHAHGGKTHAANLKCYCRTHHLVKTFWGWREQQLADGTLILTSPSGDTYVTTPGSALLFPSLCRAVGGMPAPATGPPQDYCEQRSAMMPKRRRTRSQDRVYRVAAERRRNREAHRARAGPAPPAGPSADPPPF
jgi:Domain of unknown function (DUF222)